MFLTVIPSRRRRSALVVVLTLSLAACSTTPGRAPVEDRSPVGPASRQAAKPPPPVRPATAPAPAPSSPVAALPPSGPGSSTSTAVGSSVPALAPGTYAVKPGDTLIRIGLDHGQNWRDIARWNGIDNPNLIEVGQVLRVVPPGQDPSAAATRPVPSTGRLESRPLETNAAGAPPPGPTTTAPAAQAPQPLGPTPTPAAGSPAAAVPRQGDEAVDWSWPAAGPVNVPFDDARGVKGLSISGKAGDPVLAAADGRVVYAGSGLRGYGNLVIVKHNNTYLTAYAHNQALLVKEDQTVRRGQKIAEMGSSDADQVKLHFEIRRQGKPVDPARLLPAR